MVNPGASVFARCLWDHKKGIFLLLLVFGKSAQPATGFWGKKDLLDRMRDCESMRITVAMNGADESKLKKQKTNKDLDRYSDKRGSFSKGLVHTDNGLVTNSSFKSMIKAMKSGKKSDFNAIQMGGVLKLKNPQAAYAFCLEGEDSSIALIPKAPALASAQAASEMVELYWAALLRDVYFNKYDSNGIASQAISDLNNMSDFRGPKIEGLVTAQTLLRGSTPGDLVGPYISQFLYLPVPEYSYPAEQWYYPYVSGVDYLATQEDWLNAQNGGIISPATPTFAENPIFIRNGRDLATHVHNDYPGSSAINAALILLGLGLDVLDTNNPYKNNATQCGFVTYGTGDVVSMVITAVQASFKAAWYQKWLNHLRLRPEYFGFLAHEQKLGVFNYRLHSDLINSLALSRTFERYGTYLLTTVYPEGCPPHPAYPSGHATWIGAGVTILKAYFDGDFVIPSPLEPNSSNTDLITYEGEPLTVNGELNKLASNIAIGRNFAGIHYRTDALEGMKLGEKIAISILNEEGYTKNENFAGYTLTKFDGTTITVGQKIVV
jgi:hypothetical protein